MKKNSILVGCILALSILATSCNSSNLDNEGYPSDPQEGESFNHSNGSSSIWNAAMGYWMISSIINNNRTQHRYYPGTGQYTNATGTAVNKPSYLKTNSKGKPVSKGGFGSSRGRSVGA